MCPCVSSSKYSYKNNTLPSRIGNNVRWNSPFNISATAPNNTHSRVALQPQIRRLPMTVGDGWRCTGSSYVYSPKPTAMGRKQKECCRLALCNVGTAVCGHIIAHQMQWLPILQLDWLCDKSLGIVIWRGSNTGFDQNRGLQELLLGNQDKTKGSYANKTAVHHSILFTVFNVAINSKFRVHCGCPSTASIQGRVHQAVTWADRETRLIKVLYYY